MNPIEQNDSLNILTKLCCAIHHCNDII